MSAPAWYGVSVPTAQEEVRSLVDNINQAWLQGRPDELNRYFDDRMVIRGPGFQEMGRGREACVASYRDFLRAAKILDCELSDPQIDVCGNTAVATCRWRMTYELAGQRYQESGHDLFVLSFESGAWRAVWRAMLPDPQPVTPRAAP